MTGRVRADAAPADWTRLAVPARLLAWLFVVDTVLVSLTKLVPFHAENPLWRHVAVSTLGQAFSMLTLALLILLANAWLSGSTRKLRWSSRILPVLVVLLVALLVVFLIDSRTLSATLPEDQRPRFAWLVAKGISQYVFVALVLVAASVAARRFAEASEIEAEAA